MRITLHLIKDDPHAMDMAVLALENCRKEWKPDWSDKVLIVVNGLKFLVAKTGAGFSVTQCE